MNELSQRILDRYQVRKTRKQKAEFIEFMQREIPGLRVEEGGFPRSRNLIVGDVDSADVILGAHYDTCAQLPFPNLIMPKNIVMTLLYGVAIVIPFVVLLVAAMVLLTLVTENEMFVRFGGLAVYFASLFGVMFLGKPNPHTANDNTSGVVMLCELLENAPENVAFVFFDNEENGLMGSSFYRKKHKRTLKNQLMINFDCIGDGNHMLFVLNKPARQQYEARMRACFPTTQSHTAHVERSSTTFYPSDQQGFPTSIAVAALKRNRIFGLYMDRIHTKKDTVLEESNLEYLKAGMKAFLEQR